MPVIRQQRTEFLRPAQVNRMDTGAADYAQAISRNADQLAGIAFQRAAQKAEEVGTERALGTAQSAILTINPETGRPEAFDSFTGMGEIANQAFKRIVDNRFRTEIDQDLRQKSAEFATNNPDPEAYAAAFSNYAGGLVENADPMYREFVMTTSADYLQQTKLTLVERQRARARAQAAQFLSDRVEEFGFKAQELGLSGNTEDIPALREQMASDLADGVASELINANEADEILKKFDTTVSANLFASTISNLPEHEIQSAELYIVTNGNSGSLPENEVAAAALEGVNIENRGDFLDIISPLVSQERRFREYYLTEFNNQLTSAVNAWSNLVDSRMEEAERAADFNRGLYEIGIFLEERSADEQKKLAEQIAQELQDASSLDARRAIVRSEVFQNPYLNEFYSAYIDRESASGPESQIRFFDQANGVVDALINDHLNQKSYADATYVESPDILSISERDRINNNSRQGAINAIVTTVLTTNPNDRQFFSAAIGGNNEARSELSSFGRYAADRISSFWDVSSDSKFLETSLARSDNTILRDRRAAEQTIQILDEINTLTSQIRAGINVDEDIKNLNLLLNSEETQERLSPTAIADFKKNTRSLEGFNRLASFLVGKSSEDIERALKVFNGTDSPEPTLFDANIQEVSGMVDLPDRPAMNTYMNRLLSDAKSREEKAEQESIERELDNTVLIGAAPHTSEFKERLTNILSDRTGFEPTNPMTWNGEGVHELTSQSGLFPSVVSNTLSLAVNGSVDTYAFPAAIEFYRTQTNFETVRSNGDGTTSIYRSGAASSLSEKDRLILDYAISASERSGVPVEETLKGMIEIQRDESEARRNLTNNLGNYDNVDQFLATVDLPKSGQTMADRFDLIQKYRPFAQFMFSTVEGSVSQVQEAIAKDLSSRFFSSDFVVDTGLTPEWGNIKNARVSENAPERFEAYNPEYEGLPSHVFSFFVKQVERYDENIPVGLGAISISAPSLGRKDGGYFIQVLPESQFPNDVIYQLMKEEDGLIRPAFFTDSDGNTIAPIYDVNVDAMELIQENRERIRREAAERSDPSNSKMSAQDMIYFGAGQ